MRLQTYTVTRQEVTLSAAVYGSDAATNVT